MKADLAFFTALTCSFVAAAAAVLRMFVPLLGPIAAICWIALLIFGFARYKLKGFWLLVGSPFIGLIALCGYVLYALLTCGSHGGCP